MKKIVSLFLSMLLILSFASCKSVIKSEKYCSNCGEGISKSASFCDSCGASVDNKENNSSLNTSTENKPADNTPSKTTSEPTQTTSKPTQTVKPTTSSKPAASSKPAVSSKPATSSKPVSSKPAHTHSYSKKATAATCTEKGYTTYTCSCGHSYKDDYIDPSHNYIDYVCSKCDAVDKSHAYEYLVEWVKENGEANGTIISYTYWQGASMYKLGYNAQYDSLSVSKTEKYNGVMFFSNLYLDDYFYGVSFDGSELTGFLSAEQFSASSPITYVEYTGDSNAKANFIELSRLSMSELVEWLNWFLNATEIQLTISDLGFKSYKI